MATTVTIRYFAGLADAAGTRSETVDIENGSTLADLFDMLNASHSAKFARIAAISAFLIDGHRAEGYSVIPGDGSVIDGLPPFAGG